MRIAGPPPPGFIPADEFLRDPARLAEQLCDGRRFFLQGLGIVTAVIAIIVGVFLVLPPIIAGVVACACLGTVGFVGLALTVLGIKAWSEARKELAAQPTARQVSPRT